MAAIYKPWRKRMTSEVGSDGKRRAVPFLDAEGKVQWYQAANWVIEYTDASGRRRREAAGPDKRAAAALANLRAVETMERRRGLIDPRVEAVAAQERRDIEDHLRDFLGDLEARGDGERHVEETASKINAFLSFCRRARPLGRGGEGGAGHVLTPADLDPARLGAWLSEGKRAGLAARTLNARLIALKTFSRWLFTTGRVRLDYLVSLKRARTQDDRRVERRALVPEEVERLLAAADSGGVVKGLDGPTRATIYRLALGTGFRLSEIQNLACKDFDLVADPPTITVQAAYSKRRRRDVQPIRRDLAAALVAFLALRPPAERPFEGLPRTAAAMMREDLAAARDKWIAEVQTDDERTRRERSGFLSYQDGSGHVADFHALRHTFITGLAKGGITPAVAKELARHSTIQLTVDYYTHTVRQDLSTALESLPSTSAEPKRKTQAG